MQSDYNGVRIAFIHEMEIYERKAQKIAAETMPAGYGRIYAGKLEPSDLVFDWIALEWLRNDSELWTRRVDRAEDCIAVARAGRKPFSTPTERSYTIRRLPEPTPEPSAKTQPSLFGD